MKIFYIAAEMDLVAKPAWLDEFRKKYDEPHPYHITLKYPQLIDEAKVDKIKEEFFNLVSGENKIELEFSKVRDGKTDNGLLVMLDTPSPEKLVSLQKKMLKRFRKEGQIFKESYLDYEDNFKPHITIARHLDKTMHQNAKNELKKPKVVASITRIVLTIVGQMDIDEMKKEKNRFVGKLD